MAHLCGEKEEEESSPTTSKDKIEKKTKIGMDSLPSSDFDYLCAAAADKVDECLVYVLPPPLRHLVCQYQEPFFLLSYTSADDGDSFRARTLVPGLYEEDCVGSYTLHTANLGPTLWFQQGEYSDTKRIGNLLYWLHCSIGSASDAQLFCAALWPPLKRAHGAGFAKLSVPPVASGYKLRNAKLLSILDPPDEDETLSSPFLPSSPSAHPSTTHMCSDSNMRLGMFRSLEAEDKSRRSELWIHSSQGCWSPMFQEPHFTNNKPSSDTILDCDSFGGSWIWLLARGRTSSKTFLLNTFNGRLVKTDIYTDHNRVGSIPCRYASVRRAIAHRLARQVDSATDDEESDSASDKKVLTEIVGRHCSCAAFGATSAGRMTDGLVEIHNGPGGTFSLHLLDCDGRRMLPVPLAPLFQIVGPTTSQTNDSAEPNDVASFYNDSDRTAATCDRESHSSHTAPLPLFYPSFDAATQSVIASFNGSNRTVIYALAHLVDLMCTALSVPQKGPQRAIQLPLSSATVLTYPWPADTYGKKVLYSL